tara:strand:+ start:162 stop:539 length:378 start_codon:yes stop_codon:yes gene_type:complete
MKKITIYTQDSCGYCKVIKDELIKNNIEFEEKLINEHRDEWNKITQFTNLPATPTIYYKDSYFVPGRDFGNAENLINILNSFEGIGDISLLHVLEKIKTLNYNMGSAFGRLNKELKTIEEKIDKQ